VGIFGKFVLSFVKYQNNPISSWKNRKFLEIFINFTTILQRPLFSKKKRCSDLAQNWLK